MVQRMLRLAGTTCASTC